jgi:general secretion pathway protein G
MRPRGTIDGNTANPTYRKELPMTVRHSRAAARVAFTLMEVLVVVAILVVLAGVGGVIYMRYLEEAKKDIAKTQIQTLSETVEMYKVKNGDYPANLVVLTELQPDGGSAILEQSALKDPWQMDYVYEPENRNPLTGKPRIYSFGGNMGNQAGIISNW